MTGNGPFVAVAEPDRTMPERVALRPLPGGRSERALVERVHAGDDVAFEAIYDGYHRRLLAFCRHMLGSVDEAEDAVQHTFLAAYRALRNGYDVVDLKPWLYTIARNRCLSVMRARRENAALDDRAPAVEGLAAEVDRRADLRLLVSDVQRLPPDQRAALILFEVGDHSHREIAAVLGVRREKVKALVYQAREALLGWRSARETPCADVREQLATLRGSALGRGSIRRHVEQCPGCADFEAAVRGQRAALAVALPVVPAVGLRAAVLSSTVGGGSAVGAAVGAGGAATAGGGLAGLGASGFAAKTLVVAALVGGVGAGGREALHVLAPDGAAAPAAEAAQPPPSPPATLRVSAAAVRARGGLSAAALQPAAHDPAAAEHPAARPAADARDHRDVVPAAHGGRAKHAATGKAAAPGQLKVPSAPAQGKALGSGQGKARAPKPARANPGRGSGDTKPAKAKVDGAPAKPPKPPDAAEPDNAVKAVKAPEQTPPSEAAAPATPGAAEQSPAVPPGQSTKQDEPPKKP
jgi:RNA polymerase sigma factor (sigma-70 family)